MIKFKKLAILFTAMLAMNLMIADHGECRKKGYNYITVQEFKARMDAGEHETGAMLIVTTQTEAEYASGHLKAAYPTYARPLKSESDFEKLNPFLEIIKTNEADIIIICPRGRGGAEIPFDYFKENGIATERMFILEDGQEAFNKAYPDDISSGN